jgi:hypothetical protein
MHIKFKNSIALFLLAVLLSPMAIKAVHHHHSLNTFFSGKERQLHPLQEKCSICNFEYSVFFPFKATAFSAIPFLADYSVLGIHEAVYVNFLHFSFLLRAPPFVADFF